MDTKSNKASKAVTFTLTDAVLSMLKELADINSNSMSYEIRRLIKDEYARTQRNGRETKQ